MQVNRVYHIRTRLSEHTAPGAYGGATVLVSGDTDHSQVGVKVAYCNPIDTFSKKIGRETASKAVEKIIPLRRLPGELAHIWREVHKRSHIVRVGYDRPNFDNRLFDFLPKEL